MKILNHPACTHQLGAPSDMQDGSCDALPVMYQTTVKHGTFAVSFWQPDAEDLAELLAGGGIALHVRAPGRQHPVVALGTFPCPDGFEASGMQMEELAKRWYGPVREQLAQAQAENKELRDAGHVLHDELKKCREERDQLQAQVTAMADSLRQIAEAYPVTDEGEYMVSVARDALKGDKS